VDEVHPSERLKLLRDKRSMSGKVVETGAHPGGMASVRHRRRLDAARVDGGEALRWGTTTMEGSCSTPTTWGK
jgi:hypothetical protein